MMLVERDMKPDNETSIIKERDMKSGDTALMKNQPEDKYYYYYYYYVDNNNIALIPIEVVSKITVSEKVESSNNLASKDNALSSPSAPDLRVIEDKTEIQYIVPGKKLSDMDSRCDLELEEIDISEALLPYLTLIESNVEEGNKNIKEFGQKLAPSPDHSDTKQPGHTEHSAECNAVDVTTIDSDFSTVFREECKKQLRVRREGECQALSDTVTQCSTKKEATKCTTPAQNSERGCQAQKGANSIVQDKFYKKEEMGKCIAEETTVGLNSPIPSANSETASRKRKMPCKTKSTSSSSKSTSSSSKSTSSSSKSTSSCSKNTSSSSKSTSSSICNSFQLDPIDERNWDMFLARKCLNQNKLMHDLQISVSRDNPGPGQKKRLKKEESCISAKESCIASPISSTSSKTCERKRKKTEIKRKSSHGDISSISSITKSRSNPKINQLNHMEEKVIEEKENRNTLNELRVDTQLLIPELDSMNERHWDVFLEKQCQKQNKLTDDRQISVPRNNPGNNMKKCGNKEKCKSLVPEIGAEFFIANTSSETGTERKRKLHYENISSNSLTSGSRGIPEIDKLDNEKNKKLVEKEIRKRQNELMEDFRNITPELDLMNERNLDMFLAKKRQKLKQLTEFLQNSASRKNPGSNQSKRGKKEKCKSLSRETAIGVESSLASINSETSAGRKRKPHEENVSSNSLSSNSRCVSEVDKLHNKQNKKIVEKEIRKRQNELMEEFRFLKTEQHLTNEENLDRFIDNESRKQNKLLDVLQISVPRNNPGSYRDQCKSISRETALDAESSFASTSSESRAGRKRKPHQEKISSNSLTSSPRGISEVDKLHNKQKEKIVEKEITKKQKELMEDFRLLKPDQELTKERNLDRFIPKESRKQNELLDVLDISVPRSNSASNRDQKEKFKSISRETAVGAESSFASTSSETLAGRKRKPHKENVSSNSLTSNPRSISEVDKLHNKQKEKIVEKEIRKKENERMEDFRLLKPEELPKERNLDQFIPIGSRKQNEWLDVLQTSVPRNNLECNRDQKQKFNSISQETALGAESSFTSTSSETRAVRTGNPHQENVSFNSLTSNPRGISEVDKLNNKQKEKIIEKEIRKRQNELMEEFRFLKTEQHLTNEKNLDRFIAKESRKENELLDVLQIPVSRKDPESTRDRNEKCKSISPETAITEYPIKSTSSETRAGRKRKPEKENVSSNSLTFNPRSNSEVDKLHNKQKEKIVEKEIRKRQNELMGEFRFLKTEQHLTNDKNLDRFIAKDSRKQYELLDVLDISVPRNNPGSNQDQCKSISRETTIGAESSFASTSSETRAGRKRRPQKENVSSNSLTSNPRGISDVDKLHNKQKEKVVEKEIRKRQNELMEDFRLLKPEQELTNERNLDQFMAKESLKQNELVDVLQIPVPQNNPESNRDPKEKCKNISPETAIAKYPITSTSSETRAGRKRKLNHEAIFSNSLPSIPHGISEVDELVYKKKRKLLEKENQKREKELTENLRLSIPGLLNSPQTKQIVILTFARDYIYTLEQNLEGKQKIIEHLKNKNKLLLQECGNIIDELEEIPINMLRK